MLDGLSSKVLGNIEKLIQFRFTPPRICDHFELAQKKNERPLRDQL